MVASICTLEDDGCVAVLVDSDVSQSVVIWLCFCSQPVTCSTCSEEITVSNIEVIFLFHCDLLDRTTWDDSTIIFDFNRISCTVVCVLSGTHSPSITFLIYVCEDDNVAICQFAGICNEFKFVCTSNFFLFYNE